MCQAKNYLRQYRNMVIIENQLKHELEDLERQRIYIKGIAYDGIKVKSSSNFEGFTTLSDAIADKTADIRQAITNSINVRTTIVAQIHLLEDSRYIIILYNRYIKGLSFEVIAEMLGYEYYWCCRLHGEALKAFDDKFIKQHK